MLRILAIGHSHLHALKTAYEDRTRRGATRGQVFDFAQLVEARYKPVLRDGELNAEIAMSIKGATYVAIVASIGGNEHNILGLLNHPTRFDFILPENEELALQDDADILPFGLVRRRMERLLKPPLGFLSVLRKSTQIPLYHLESPPPVPSQDHIRKYPGAFREHLNNRGVSPAALRYKLWRLQSEVFRETCGSRDIHFVPVPPSMQDERGMLLECGWNPDPTHGNSLYGEHVLRQIDRLIFQAAA